MAPFLARTARTLFRGTTSPSAEKIEMDDDYDDDVVPHPPSEVQKDNQSRTARKASLVSSSDTTWSTALEDSDDIEGPPAALATSSVADAFFKGEALQGDDAAQRSGPVVTSVHSSASNKPTPERLSLAGSGRTPSAGSRSGGSSSSRRRASRLSTTLRRLSLRRQSSPKTANNGTRGGDDADEDKIDQMMGLLTEEQIEMAARTNYRYYCRAAAAVSTPAAASNGDEEAGETTSPENVEDPETLRIKYARDMARRYLRSNRHHDPHAAVHKLAATLQFRQEMDVDGLRTAFCDPKSPHRTNLLQRLSDRAAYVCGFDVDGRSTFVFEPHRVQGHDENWTVRQHVYTLERAVACSRASDQTVNAVVNFRGFSYAKHAPPAHIGQQFFTTLRSHYAGHVHQIFIVDAPTAFYCLWTLLKPFIGRTTRSKIQFVNSESQKKVTIGKYYQQHQARPWMLPNGQKRRELDLDEYLFKTPFDSAFDEK